MAEWEMSLDVDTVLRFQGADPQALRENNSRLVSITEQAIALGETLLKPSVHESRRRVIGNSGHTLHIEDGGSLSGPLVQQHLATASEIVAMVCTIGPDLERYVAEVMTKDPGMALALDGVGSAAVGALSQLACRRLDAGARSTGQQVTIPLSPGMPGWPLAEGQRQLFALLGKNLLDVRLNDSCMMIPSKSLSMVIGIGTEVRHLGKPCDYCSVRHSCLYQDQHA